MENKSYAPVVLFVYNRPEHTERLLNSINALEETPYTKLYIFSDAAKNGNAQEKVDEVRKLIDSFTKDTSRFCNVEIRKAPKNRGLENSIIAGVTEIINRYGRAIVLEDDLIVSKNFLQYMNDALDYYESNPNIWAISGYTFPMNALKDYKHDVYFSGRGCSWGWGTWANRWNTVDWQVSDYNSFKHDWKKRCEFAKWGVDLPEMLDAYMEKEIHSWAIRWCYSAFKQGKVTVYPIKSKVSNCGTDGTGTNYTTSVSRYNTVISAESERCVFENCVPDKHIQHEFANKYAGGFELFKLRVRWFLIRNGVIKANKI